MTDRTTDAPSAPRRRRLLILVPLVLFGAMAVMFAFALTKGDPARLPSALIGKPAPALALTAIEGLQEGPRAVPLLTSELLQKGAVTVVNFWASWCLPCVEEHPLLIEIAQKASVPVLGINYKDAAANARRFLGRYGNPYAAVGADTSGRTAIEWGVYGMPETFILDGQGRVAYKHVGPITQDALERTILPTIARLRAGKPG
ncbi:DsbE family thiol:disulfide interchange protein [Hyphomicrobium sp. CS1BSMeth3]|uniref:DsbE family thiol:disulfide interchange protein n=1 Tax=Hyphomicrobium sp. CS1BSMeth3 TaxID=1892844 RepID=UPI0009306898|nr:DsbE family thiol:disulfide interchange protein [Hyphomicrobium sp. CS1BSMeth3]